MKSKKEAKVQASKFTFMAPLAHIEGNYVEHGIFLPNELIEKLPEKRLRAKGTINGISFALAIQYRKNGLRFFMINKKLVKEAKLKTSLSAEVEFVLVDSEFVEIPEELEAVLEQDEEANNVWATFTQGLKRSLVHYVTSVKNTDSRIKRAIELMEKAKRGTLVSQKTK